MGLKGAGVDGAYVRVGVLLERGRALNQTLINPSMFCSCSERKPQDEETWRITRNVEGLKRSVGGAYRLMESA